MNFEKSQIDSIVASLSIAEKEMQRDYSKERIALAKYIIESGFVENILSGPIVQNIINLIAPFIKNDKVKKAVKLMQEGLQEEKARLRRRR